MLHCDGFAKPRAEMRQQEPCRRRDRHGKCNTVTGRGSRLAQRGKCARSRPEHEHHTCGLDRSYSITSRGNPIKQRLPAQRGLVAIINTHSQVNTACES